MENKRLSILVHACCGTCAAYVVKLLSEEYEPTIYYYNPNIHTYEEYQKRKNDLVWYANEFNYGLIEDKYDAKEWFDNVKGFENEPEKGMRCNVCFEMRLKKAAEYAANNNYDIFTTTLTVSPHKNSKEINRIGKEIEKEYGIKFYKADFKKKDGFKKTMQMSKEFGFYRQNFCGCLFSNKKYREISMEELERIKKDLIYTNES